MKKLTEKQAFMAMISFLDQYYEQTKSDDVAALLGSLQLLSDEMPADSAMYDDWLLSVEKTLSTFTSEKIFSV